MRIDDNTTVSKIAISPKSEGEDVDGEEVIVEE
jgi:hypothetical protein